MEGDDEIVTAAGMYRDELILSRRHAHPGDGIQIDDLLQVFKFETAQFVDGLVGDQYHPFRHLIEPVEFGDERREHHLIEMLRILEIVDALVEQSATGILRGITQIVTFPFSRLTPVRSLSLHRRRRRHF